MAEIRKAARISVLTNCDPLFVPWWGLAYDMDMSRRAQLVTLLFLTVALTCTIAAATIFHDISEKRGSQKALGELGLLDFVVISRASSVRDIYFSGWTVEATLRPGKSLADVCATLRAKDTLTGCRSGTRETGVFVERQSDDSLIISIVQ
jgi:hypothetical protein